MSPWISHLLTATLGLLAGALGTYYGTRLTELRRQKESRAENFRLLEELVAIMPDLIAELRDDFRNPEHQEVREFVLLPSETVRFGTSQKRFAYYESKHENLRGKVAVLENKGLVSDVTPGNTPIFRATERLRSLLLEQ